MPPVTFATPEARTAAVHAEHRSDYTDAQWRALARVKQVTPPLKLGAARNEFVNKVMLPNGSISDDLAAIRNATVQADQDDIAKLDTFTKQHADDILKGTLSRELRPQLQDLQYWANHSQTDEFDSHVAQNRFLLIVDAANVVRIWFQCVTPDNPDIEYANDSDDPTFTQRQAAREASEQARIKRGG